MLKKKNHMANAVHKDIFMSMPQYAYCFYACLHRVHIYIAAIVLRTTRAFPTRCDSIGTIRSKSWALIIEREKLYDTSCQFKIH